MYREQLIKGAMGDNAYPFNDDTPSEISVVFSYSPLSLQRFL